MAITKYEQPQAGVDLGSAEVLIDDTALNDYYEGLDLEPPAEFAVVPTMVAANADLSTACTSPTTSATSGCARSGLPRPPASRPALHRQRQIAGRLRAPRPHRDLTETELRDPDGDVVVVQRHHQSFVLYQSEGEVTCATPPRRRARASSMCPKASRSARLERTITLEMCGAFFHGDRNYHTNKEASAELGFTDVVVGGKMTMSLLGELLDQRFGAAWASSGRLLIKFANIVWPNETVRVRGVLQGTNADDPSRRDLFCWVEKDNGVIAVVAEGSVAL